MIPLNALRLAACVSFAAAGSAAAASGPDTFANGQSFYGRPATASGNARVVEVGAMKSVGVRYGETVVFRSEGKEFSWTFDGLELRSVELSKIAPRGFTTLPFTIYVPLNPLMRN